jgi:hypothetical protein
MPAGNRSRSLARVAHAPAKVVSVFVLLKSFLTERSFRNNAVAGRGSAC